MRTEALPPPYTPEYDEARRDVKKLLEGDAKHREGRALLTRIKKLEAVQAKKDAKVRGGVRGEIYDFVCRV